MLYGPYANEGSIDCSSSSLSANLAACNDDDPNNSCGTGPPYSSTIQVPVTQGEVYLVRVGGWNSAESGTGVLSIGCAGVATGACCFGDGTCQDTTGADCASSGGTYQGDGTDCSPNPCPQPPATGGCCFGDGTCSVETSADCSSAGGIYEGDNTNCSPNPCPQPPATGACCFGDGSCAVLTQANCNAGGGTYEGDGTDCTPNPCPQPTGACCFGDGTCTIETAVDCAGAGGAYQGDGTDCSPNPCQQPDPTGACCFGDGTCTVETAADCSAAGGLYQGDDTNCMPNPCPLPTGACCFGDGTCSVEIVDDCNALGGTYQGDGTDCSPNPCPQPPATGACCFGDGTCSIETAADCAAAGGAYEGDDTGCSPNPCPQPPMNVILEAGTVNVGGSSVTVNLDNTFVNPVVVCSIQYSNNSTPVVPRVSNVTGSSFDVRIQNPSNGAVASDLVNYIVVEEGVHTVNGVNFEAQSYTSTVTDGRNGGWNAQAQSYLQSYSNPVVIGQVMTENDPDFSIFWCRGSGRNAPPNASDIRTGKQVAEDSDTTRANETVGFIVFEAGSGSLNGVPFTAALGGDSIRGIGNNPPFNYGLSGFSGAPAVAVVTQAAMDGNNGGWAYTFGAPSATTLPLVIDEDQIRDNERNHTTEQVGYVVFQSAVSVN